MTTSPLVNAYLADLDRALAGADPGDRAEIVDAVREHIDAALAELGAAPSQAEIAGVLRRLGSADTVASAWVAGERTTSPMAVASGVSPLPYAAAADGLPYGAGGGSGQPVPPHARPVNGAPGGSAASKLPTWATVLLIAIGVVVLAPPLLAVLAVLFLVPIGGGIPGWLGIGAGLVLVAASVACLVVGRRAERHRTAWLVSGIVGLVLALPLLVTSFGLAGHTGGASSGGPAVRVDEETPAGVTPLPMGG